MTGYPNKKEDDFVIIIDAKDYISEWRNLFHKLSSYFKIKLGKEIKIPF
ncbi:hypothetical protein [Superficieibacter sp. 1612_C1]|nr:hypothetical protein [Superficieibacter sp. 1612_C1]